MLPNVGVCVVGRSLCYCPLKSPPPFPHAQEVDPSQGINKGKGPAR